MMSFALILMTLPSRVAEVRAGRADGARHAESSTGRAVRGGLPDSSADSHTSGAHDAVTSLSGEGACAPRIESRFQRWRSDIGRIPGAVPQAKNDRRAFGAKKISFSPAATEQRSRE